MYIRTAISSGGMGSIPQPSIFALESAEYLGRRAAVRNSRSLVGRRSGFKPASVNLPSLPVVAGPGHAENPSGEKI